MCGRKAAEWLIEMPLCRIQIDNFKSIKYADLSINHINMFIGENGAGKTNVLDAVDYFYSNLSTSNIRLDVFDCNNHFSNQIRIRLSFDLSGFVKIAKAQSEPNGDNDSDSSGDSKYVGYYRKIISMSPKSQNYIYILELSQIKGQPIRWNYGYEDRSIIKSLFPLFHLDTRFLDIHKWDYLWEVIGELGKVANSERKSLESKINSILLDHDGEIAKKLYDISKIFEDANVNIKPATSKDFASTLTKIFFSGNTVQQSGKSLGYYSTGTNSAKYIELLLKAIDKISKSKLKEPLVLLDEPEISLHPQLVDELSDTICEVDDKLCFLISSHSSRLTKNLMIESEHIELFDIRLVSKYSDITRMKLFPQYSPISTPRVTDDHVNSYFSRAILFVEGETELELFSNPYLHILFPALHVIDVYKALSDKPVLSIMHPEKNQVTIPYLCLIDMDKAVGYNPITKKYFTRNEYISDNHKEQFLFRSKHANAPYIYHQRKRIDAMASRLHIHYFQPLLSTNDPSHTDFVETVHKYLLNYNVFIFSTTIEGALINKNSVGFSIDFLKGQIKEDAYTSFLSLLDSSRSIDKLNFLRLVFDGKSDLWQTYKSIKKRLDSEKANVIDSASVGKKTSGWVTKYIEAFLAKELGVANLSERAFKRQMEDEQGKLALINSFKAHFPELYDLLQKVCGMI